MKGHDLSLARKEFILAYCKAELATAFLSEYAFAEENPGFYHLSDEELVTYKKYIDDLFDNMMDYSIL